MNLTFPAWDPVLLDIPGPIDLRWYGLTYILGFIVAQWIVTRLAKGGLLPIAPEKVGDLMVALLIGVILGGRIGYGVFYDQALADPFKLVKLWEGGMSFHGGLIGVFVAFTWWSLKNDVPWLRLGDAAALCVTPGIFFVRMSNFINGELYGRVTDEGVFGAMRFPTDPAATSALGLSGVNDTRSKELAIQVAYDHLEWSDVSERMAPAYSDGTAIPWGQIQQQLDWSVAQESVPFRHPSQLYEGLSEGLLLGLILFVLFRLLRKRPLGPGGYGGIFLLGYGVARSLIENLRQPDTQFTSADDPIGTVFMGLTMGQTLSAFMIAAGLYFTWRGIRTRGEGAAPEPASA